MHFETVTTIEVNKHTIAPYRCTFGLLGVGSINSIHVQRAVVYKERNTNGKYTIAACRCTIGLLGVGSINDIHILSAVVYKERNVTHSSLFLRFMVCPILAANF